MGASYIQDSGGDNAFAPQLVVATSGAQAKINLGDSIGINSGNSVTVGVGASLTGSLSASTSIKIGTSIDVARSDSATIKYGRSLTLCDNTSSSQSKANVTSGVDSWTAKGGCTSESKLRATQQSILLTGFGALVVSAGAIIVSALYGLKNPPVSYSDPSSPPTTDGTDGFSYNWRPTTFSLGICAALFVIEELLINYFLFNESVKPVAKLVLDNNGASLVVNKSTVDGFGYFTIDTSNDLPAITIKGQSNNLKTFNQLTMDAEGINAITQIGTKKYSLTMNPDENCVELAVSQNTMLNLSDYQSTLTQKSNSKLTLQVQNSSAGQISLTNNGVVIGTGMLTANFTTNQISLGNLKITQDSIAANATGNLRLNGGIIQIG